MARRHAKRRTHAPAIAIAGMALSSGCAKDFAGPYPCNTGYSSCVTADRCETSIVSDPEHCGECGKACPQGAICTDGECSAAPPVLATDVFPMSFAMNGDNLFWSSTSNAGVAGFRKQSDALFGVTTPDAQPQVGTLFAVDETDLYYLAQPPSGAMRLQAVPADSVAAPQVRVVLELPQGAPNQLPLVLAGDLLFFSRNMNDSLVVESVPKTGGSVAGAARFPDANGSFVVDSTNVYATTTRGPCNIKRVPVSGGDATTLVPQQQHGCPQALASDGERLYWASAYIEYPTNSDGNDNGNSQSNQRCLVEVASIPVDGGAITTRASLVADELPLRIAIDGSDVYLATDKSVWRIPDGDSAPTRVAGNLGASNNQGTRGPGFTGCIAANGGSGFGGQPNPVAVTVDDKDIYIVAEKDSTTGTLFRIRK
jgi:hypothetical protein